MNKFIRNRSTTLYTPVPFHLGRYVSCNRLHSISLRAPAPAVEFLFNYTVSRLPNLNEKRSSSNRIPATDDDAPRTNYETGFRERRLRPDAAAGAEGADGRRARPAVVFCVGRRTEPVRWRRKYGGGNKEKGRSTRRGSKLGSPKCEALANSERQKFRALYLPYEPTVVQFECSRKRVIVHTVGRSKKAHEVGNLEIAS
ncbi:hypothetical protein EVAR_80739_1 [Eumeta japonica]|uniref:Uncharacterized protein n=1 Tax=Eumeta variegata TaxID=151549 RepID=A0A4C1U3Q0_EUMVA|nr:hypothetical protein EVAR_80739_1 [Eumeta japonica]